MPASNPPSPAIFMLAPGATFNRRFEVVRCIKAGGMGAVYEVIHRDTRRRRALKTMLPDLVSDAGFKARFQLEATIAADIDSQHIVEVVDAGVDDETGMPFIVMELLKGEELGEALERRGRFPAEDVIRMLEQAAYALDRTHAAGIVHRDLKPENLFLSKRDDGTIHVTLLDFGIAKIRVAHTGSAKTTLGIGSPLYMAPEQIRGEASIGPAADTYALAHIAFALLCGEAYWEKTLRDSSVYALLLAKTSTNPEERASARATGLGVALPPGIDSWFDCAAAVEPTSRFAIASDLVESLAVTLGVLSSRKSNKPRVSTEDVARASSPETEDARLPWLGFASGSDPHSPTRRAEPWTTTNDAAPTEPIVAAGGATGPAVTRDLKRQHTRWQAGGVAALLVSATGIALVFGLRERKEQPSLDVQSVQSTAAAARSHAPLVERKTLDAASAPPRPLEPVSDPPIALSSLPSVSVPSALRSRPMPERAKPAASAQKKSSSPPSATAFDPTIFR